MAPQRENPRTGPGEPSGVWRNYGGDGSTAPSEGSPASGFELTAVVLRSFLRGNNKLVLAQLADYAHLEDGRWLAWPSNRTLAIMTGLSKNTITARLDDLKGKGILDRTTALVGSRGRALQVWEIRPDRIW